MAQQTKHVWAGIGYVNGKLGAPASVRQFLAAMLTPVCGITAAMALLLSQAALPGGAMPFCVPLAAALLLLQKPVLPVLAGCAASLLIRWAPITWINGWQLAACAGLMLLVRKGWNWKPWKVATAAAAFMLLPLPFVTRRLDLMIICLSGAAAAGLLTPVYLRALLAVGTPSRPLSMDDKLCCLLLAAALSLGGLWVKVDALSLGAVLAAFTVYLIAHAAGVGLALPAGVLLGLSMMVSGAPFETVSVLAVLGALSGMLRGNRRVFLLLGGTLACALVAFAQGGLAQVALLVPPVGAGGLLFLLLPVRWLDSLTGMLGMPEIPAEPSTSACAYVLSTYAESMAGMARALPAPEKAKDAQPVELLACRLCTGCEGQQACWDENRQDSMALLDGVLLACAGDANPVEIEQAARMKGCQRADEVYGLASGLIAARLKKEKEDARRMEARAWALEQLRGQSRALSALADKLDDADGETARARAAIYAAMPALRGRPDALTVSLIDGRLHVWLDVRCGDGQIDRLEAALGAALGRPMEALAEQSLRDAPLFVEKPGLKLVVGRAAMPIAGEDISGDSVLSERLDAGRHVLAISDGMGSGRAARGESRAALDLLLNALRAGYSRADALRTVNGLLVACRGDEMFATVDLCVVDLDSGEAALDKLGACPSFLLRAGKCKRIGGDALPMGILDAVRPRALAARLQPGDLLLMVSDGVMDAFGGEEGSLVRALGGLAIGDKTPNPQRFADTLLRRAFERSGGTALDDMTVLAATVEEA